MPGLKLKGNKKMSSSELVVFNKPKYVYIPLISFNDTNLTELVKKGDFVFKGTILAKRKGTDKMPIYSSVSGKVMDFEEHTYLNGDRIKCVKIENDFKETIEQVITPRKMINDYTKEEFISILKDNNIVGLGGAGYPTYLKYDVDTKINTLIVNAVECEPYLSTDFMLSKKKCEEILETVDAILEINSIEEAIIVVKETNEELISIFESYIGTYLNIKLDIVPDKYPSGWERDIVKRVKNISYDKYPIEKGIVVNNVSTIYTIYEALKIKKPLIERVVTFTGELKKPCNVLVKIGTKISDVIDFIGGSKKDNVIYVANGPMMGNLVDLDLVTSATLGGVLVLNETKKVQTTACLRCGKCASVCPSKLCPVMIMDNKNKKDKLEKLDINKCISCGLCSYICPAKIDVRSVIRNLRGDK